MGKKPNILFIMTDHTNSQAIAPDSQCLTPNLDKLSAEGVRFDSCYTTNAICSPARASLMTSLYPSTHGMWDCTHTQRKEWVDVPKERFIYFSNQLSDASYTNGYFGKWHVEQSLKLEDFGWHEYDTSIGGLGRKEKAAHCISIPKEGYNDCILAGIDETPEEAKHPAFERGIEFIQKNAGKENPFCCFVSTSEPHDSYVPPKEFMDMYDVDSISVSPTLREEQVKKPEVLKRMAAVWAGLSDDEWKFISAAYWAVITFLDKEVGRIIDVLKETGEYDNTIIVFTSDHGDMLGSHGLATKGVGTSYEEVYNIPLVMRAPGFSPIGEDTLTRTSLIDLGPTLLDLCGVKPFPVQQGRSLRPVLEGTADKDGWQDAYAEFFGQRFVYTQRMTWHGDWKYVFTPGGIDELYNLKDDPHEIDNLIDDPAHQETLKDMCRRMWLKMMDIGDESLFKTQYATLRTAPFGPNIVSEKK